MSLECKFYSKYFDDYCLGNLSDSDKILYNEHVASCEGCTEELTVYNKTVSLVDSVTAKSFDDSFWERQHNAICSAAGIKDEVQAWVAPKYLLVVMLVMVGAYVIDGIGFLYVSSSYLAGIKILTNGGPGQYFDLSFLIYGMFVLIGINSFVSESRTETFVVVREAS